MFIALAVALDLEIHQMLKQLFSKHLSEEVYMEQPEGFVSEQQPNLVYTPEKLVWAQASPIQWNRELDSHLQQNGFQEELNVI